MYPPKHTCIRLLLIVLVCVTFVKAREECKDNSQTSLESNCYTFVGNATDKALSLKEANAVCNQLNGSSLVSVESAKVQDFLHEEVTSRDGGDSKWWTWTSGVGRYDQWRWTDDGGLLGLQGCFSFRKHTRLNKICYNGNSSSEVTPARCREECAVKKCFFKINSAGIYQNTDTKEARCICFADDNYWKISLHSAGCTTPCEADNTTICGGPKLYDIYAIDGTFTAWKNRGDVKGWVYKNACAKMDRESGYLWTKEDCTEKNGYICQKGEGKLSTTSCPNHFIPIGRTCVLVATQQITWFEAKMACAQQGATLVSIRGEGFQNSLQQLLTRDEKYNISFWIGATSFSWKWGNGHPMTYFDWLGGPDPNPHMSGTELTVVLTHDSVVNSSDNTGWTTQSKAPGSNYIQVCEKAMPPRPTEPTQNTPTKTPSTGNPSSSATTGAGAGPLTTTVHEKHQAYQSAEGRGPISPAAISAIVVIAALIIIVTVIGVIVVRRRKDASNLATKPTTSMTMDQRKGDPSINTTAANIYEIPTSILRNQSVKDDDAIMRRQKMQDKEDSPTLKRSSFENPCYRSYDDGLDATDDMYELEMPDRLELNLAGDLAIYDNNQNGDAHDKNERF